MVRSTAAVLIAAAMLASASHAAPDRHAIVEGLDNAFGIGTTTPAAVSVEGCETVAGQPGYDCTFSVSECFEDDMSIAECDDPGYSQRALFVGGDNGWIALDIQYSSETAPHVPLDLASPLMNGLTPQWLEGYWNFDNCENDGGFAIERDGEYSIHGAVGRWALADNILTITLTHDIDIGGTSEPTPITEPEPFQWPMSWLGPHSANITLENGENRQVMRCF